MAPFRAQGVEQRERAPHDTHEVVGRVEQGGARGGRMGVQGSAKSRIESSQRRRV